MFFVFCLFCVFFGQKEKKEQIMQKRAERKNWFTEDCRRKKAKAKTYKNKVDRSSEEAHDDAHTRARTHHIIIKIERTTRNTTKHHGTRFCRSIRKRTGTSSVLFFSS